jgi:bifunctional non-homologous end joining protein LigD
VKKAGGRVTHAVINNAATLVYLANQACITPHVWLSREDTLDHPDLMIFDLDPAGDDEFDVVRRAARSLRDLLKEVHLPAYLRTTGSRGLHVAVPLDRSEGFDTVRDFAQDLARVLEARDPTGLTTAPRKAKRRGRLFLDTARNAYAQTAVASYAVRAKPGAPVAAPVDWKELESASFHAQKFTIKNIFRRLATAGDPWDQMWRQARSLRSPRRRLDALMAKAQKPL